MSDNSSSAETSGSKQTQEPVPAVSNSFSSQPSTLVETTLAETLGLSMHNAVTSQQSSQMTTAASITNACARLLQATKMPPARIKEKKAPEEIPEQPPIAAEKSDAPPPKKKFNIMNFIKPKKKQAAEEPTESATASVEIQVTANADETAKNDANKE